MHPNRGISRRRHFGRRIGRESGLTSAIHTPRELHQMIDMECARADRYNSRFSLAVFEVGTGNENSVLIRRLVRMLHQRFRSTDDVGWYSRSQIGVVMPFTPGDGAWKLAEYICGLMAGLSSSPAFAIFSYPSQNWPHHTLRRRVARALGLGSLSDAIRGPRIPRAAEFHALISRERGRSDRNGNIFSLVVFDLGSAPAHLIPARRLVNALLVRLRDTDEIGMLSPTHLGVILPYSDAAAATRISEGVCRAIEMAPAGGFAVYTYPDEWFPGEMPVSGRYATASQAALLFKPLPLWKRLLDVVGASVALLLASPAMLLTAALIRLVSPGPLLFRQARVGFTGRTFTLLKFRTMKVDTDAGLHSQYVRKLILEDSESKPMVKQEHNPDIIPMGRWIRALCVDELPQLFNVLRGEMSLVGPRPCMPYEADEYLRWHARRFDSLPGMTGLWQVSGKNRTTFKEMIRFDIKYELNRSLWMDLRILCATPAAIVRQLLEKRHPPAASLATRDEVGVPRV